MRFEIISNRVIPCLRLNFYLTNLLLKHLFLSHRRDVRLEHPRRGSISSYSLECTRLVWRKRLSVLIVDCIDLLNVPLCGLLRCRSVIIIELFSFLNVILLDAGVNCALSPLILILLLSLLIYVLVNIQIEEVEVAP